MKKTKLSIHISLAFYLFLLIIVISGSLCLLLLVSVEFKKLWNIDTPSEINNSDNINSNQYCYAGCLYSIASIGINGNITFNNISNYNMSNVISECENFCDSIGCEK